MEPNEIRIKLFSEFQSKAKQYGDMAKEYALKALIDGQQYKEKNEQTAKEWYGMAMAMEEAMRIVDRILA